MPDEKEGAATRLPTMKVTVLRDGIAKYEKLGDEARSIMSAAMTKVKGLREKQRDVIEATVAQGGVTKKALKVHLKEREFDRKKAELTKDMDGEDELSLDAMKEKLGVLADTPLGQAATGEKPAEAAPKKTGAKAKTNVVTGAFKPAAAGDAHIAAQLSKDGQPAGNA